MEFKNLLDFLVISIKYLIQDLIQDFNFLPRNLNKILNQIRGCQLKSKS